VPGQDQIIADVRTALDRATETLALLGRVPTADTAAARHALDSVRLEVLDRFRADVAHALGLPAEQERQEPAS